MSNILDDICDDGPVLSPRLSRPKGITKRQVERCIHELSEHWSDEQLNDVIDIAELTRSTSALTLAASIHRPMD